MDAGENEKNQFNVLIFVCLSQESSSTSGRESPSSKRRRIRPKIEPGTAIHQDYSNHSDNSRPSSATFTPRIENVVTMVTRLFSHFPCTDRSNGINQITRRVRHHVTRRQRRHRDPILEKALPIPPLIYVSPIPHTCKSSPPGSSYAATLPTNC